MRVDEVGQQLLELKPTITSESIDFDDLGSLPPDTFGHAYHSFMASRGCVTCLPCRRLCYRPGPRRAKLTQRGCGWRARFIPEGRPPIQHIQDAELAFVMQRYRQVHDFWHVLAGIPTSVLGELALKWFEMVHTGLPGCAVASFFGPLRLTLGKAAGG